MSGSSVNFNPNYNSSSFGLVKAGIITIRHQLCLDGPVSPPSNIPFKFLPSNSPFKLLPSHLPPFALQLSTISAILLLFIVLNVVTNLICIFLAYCQLVLLSALTEFHHSFCCQKMGVLGRSSEKILSRLTLIVFILFSKGTNIVSI